jgi:predicted TIM-barrel fold metal-dependent hydrolase
MSEAGISRAVVSATPGGGAELLYRAAPNRVVPFLRPYSDRGKRSTWFQDTETLSYVRDQLSQAPYRGIGEFHLSGDDAEEPVVRQLVALARERGMALHAHTDLLGIRTLLFQAPDIPVIWAHGGFDVPEKILRQLLGAHEQLYVELSFRDGITDAGQLTPVWSALLTDFPSRFLVGTDTYIPARWVELPELTSEIRGWLEQLPQGVASRIAQGNADRLFPKTVDGLDDTAGSNRP